MPVDFGSFGSSSRSAGGYHFGSSATSGYNFERDLALIQSRRRRNKRLNLKAKETGKRHNLLLDLPGMGLVSKTADDIAGALIGTPAGLYEMGKGATLDIRDLVTKGDVTPERLGHMGAAMGTQMYEDLRHPLRHPGYTLMDVFALGSMGLGTTARLGAAAGRYAEMTRGASAASRAFARAGALAEGMPTTTSGAAARGVQGILPKSMNPFRGGIPTPKERGNLDLTAPEAHAATGAPEPVNPLRTILPRIKRRTAQKQLESLTRIITSRPGAAPLNTLLGETPEQHLMRIAQPEEKLAIRDLTERIKTPEQKLAEEDSVKAATQARQSAAAEQMAAQRAAVPRVQAEQEARRRAEQQARQAEGQARSEALAEQNRAYLEQQESQRLATSQAAARSTNPLVAAIPEGIRPPNVPGELPSPSGLPTRPEAQLQLFGDQPPSSPLAVPRPGPIEAAPVQRLLEAGTPGGEYDPSFRPVGPPDPQLALPMPVQRATGELPRAFDPRARAEKIDAAKPAVARRAAAASDLRAPRAAGSPETKRATVTSTEERHAAPAAAAVENEAMMNMLADMQSRLEKLTGPAAGEVAGAFRDIPGEQKVGRPPQEGGFSGPQEAKIREMHGKISSQRSTEPGVWHLEYGGNRAGTVELRLGEDGKPIQRMSIFDSHHGAQPERAKVYDVHMVNPLRQQGDKMFTAGEPIPIVARTHLEALDQARRLVSEWTHTGRTGLVRKKGTTLEDSKPVAPARAKAKPKKLVEEGDPTLRDAGYWAAQEKLKREQGPEKAYHDVSEKQAQIEANRQDAASFGDEELPDSSNLLEGVDEPNANDLAQMEAEMKSEGLPPAEVANAAKIAADPDNPIEFHANEDPDAKSGKVKALNDKTLEPKEVAALNQKLDPALSGLGLSYNEKGWLKVGDEADVEAKIEDLGFEPGEAYLIRDALEMAAGAAKQGQELTLRDFMGKLQENFPGEGEVGDIINRLKGSSGGSGVVWRDVVKAFMAPRKRQFGSVTARLPTERVIGGKKTRVFDEVTNDQVLLSNNPMIRMAWRTTYGALEAFDNPYAQGGRGNFANRQLRRKIEFENREIKQINDMAVQAGIPDAVRKYEAQVEAAKNTKFGGSPIRAWDTVNRGAMMGLLFLKPAYLSANLLGQIGLAMIDHAWNPANIYRSVKLQNELYRDGALAGARSAKIRGATGQGIMESVTPGTPGVSRAVFRGHDFVSRQYAKLLDSPFRDNAFINEAVKQGHDTPEKLAALVDAAPDSALGQEFTQVARRANRNLIDYGRMTPTEKQLVRRIIIFYPWMKGATIYGARFAAEHPAQFAGAMGIGRVGQEQIDELGVMPSYMEKQGVFGVGSRDVPGLGKVPEVMNPSAVSILGTPGEVLGMARGFVAGDIKPSEELGESITPAATAALKLFTGTDPFTGAKQDPHDSGISRIGSSLFETLPGVPQYEQLQRARQIESGEKDPRSVLQPTSQSEVLGRWLGPGLGAAAGHPLAEYAVNPREMASRGAAEQRSFQSKGEATQTKWKSYTDRARDEAKKLGFKLPPSFGKAMQQKAAREAEISTWEAANGQSTSYDRLQADMRVLVRQGKYSEQDAKALLDQAAGLDEKSITYFRRKLTDAYFGGEVTSYYKKLLTAAGADIDHGW